MLHLNHEEALRCLDPCEDWYRPLLDLLREHRAAQASATGLEKRVFLSPEGCLLNRHDVRRRDHDNALKDAGHSSRIHDLRHTAATLWLAAGESIYLVQSSWATRTSRRRSISTGTPTRRLIGKPLALPRGGEKRLRNSSVPRLVPEPHFRTA